MRECGKRPAVRWCKIIPMLTGSCYNTPMPCKWFFLAYSPHWLIWAMMGCWQLLYGCVLIGAWIYHSVGRCSQRWWQKAMTRKHMAKRMITADCRHNKINLLTTIQMLMSMRGKWWSKSWIKASQSPKKSANLLNWRLKMPLWWTNCWCTLYILLPWQIHQMSIQTQSYPIKLR